MSMTITSTALANSVIGERFLRLPQVRERTGVSRSFVYQGAKNGTFPRPIKLGERAVAWLESEITAWVEARKANRHEVKA